jgi:hypothetical protein
VHDTVTGVNTTTELDTHADTCCFGKHCYLLSESMSQTATVSGFSPKLGTLETPIVNVAVAYDDIRTGSTYILVFNQVLYIESIKHNLVSPFQLRMNDIVVNDTPLTALVQTHNLEKVSLAAHSIICGSANLQIPLSLRGTFSCFVTRVPTLQELDDERNCPRIIMTYDSPEWDPGDNQLEQTEEDLRQQLGFCKEGALPTNDNRQVASTSSSSLTRSSVDDENDFYSKVIRSAIISEVDTTGVRLARRKGTVSEEELATRWQISLEMAKRTIETTTQKGVRNFTHMQGTKRLRHLTQQLR